MQNKKSTMKGAASLVALAIVLIIAIGAIAFTFVNYMNALTEKAKTETQLEILDQQKSPLEGGTGTTEEAILVTQSGCPDTGQTSLTINNYNSMNETASENFDVTLYGISPSGSLSTTINDTTSPTASTVNCGETTVFKPIGVDGASGATSYIVSATSDEGSEVNVVDGNLVVKTLKANTGIRIQSAQHATLECRAYDNIQKALMYDSGDATNTDYETDGVVWESTTNNATVTDESLGIDMEFECRAVQSDTNYNDRGILLLVEAPSNVWDAPVIYFNGVKLSEATLSSDEKKAYSAYEYAFLIPRDYAIKDEPESVKIRVVMNTFSGVTATADPEFDFAVRTQFLATDGLSVKLGAVTDASSPAQIIAVYDSSIDVTA